MHLSNTLTPHSLNRRQDPSAKTLQASSLILAAPPSATEATSHILSHTARPSINLPHRPPIHTQPLGPSKAKSSTVGTVHPSSYPRALQIARKTVFVFAIYSSLVFSISVPNETLPHPHSLRPPNTGIITTTITTTARRASR